MIQAKLGDCYAMAQPLIQIVRLPLLQVGVIYLILLR